MAEGGGMHGRGGCASRGVCMAGAHAWQGACMVGGGVCMVGGGGHAWQGAGMAGRCGGGCAWQIL